MQLGLGNIGISFDVEDLDASISFYCGLLGQFRVSRDLAHPDGDREVILDHVSIAFSLFLRVMTDSRSEKRPADCDDAVLVLPVNDLYELAARLTAESANIDGEIVDLPWGSQLCVFDPSGLRVSLLEPNPYFGRE